MASNFTSNCCVIDTNVYAVGDVDDPDARIVKIVHISDTHMMHEQYAKTLPDGDILIHSGDFTKFSLGRLFSRTSASTFDRDIREINKFFAAVPHRHKIFVAGNHELTFSTYDRQRIREQLKHCVYLHNSCVSIKGIKFFGSPYTKYRFGSFADAFIKKPNELRNMWSSIPKDTDVVVTHSPPINVLDIGLKPVSFFSSSATCDVCHASHPNSLHYGCETLKNLIFSIRPQAHLFGHVHEMHGMVVHSNILFSNAAMPRNPVANVINYHISAAKYEEGQGPIIDFDHSPITDCNCRHVDVGVFRQ